MAGGWQFTPEESREHPREHFWDFQPLKRFSHQPLLYLFISLDAKVGVVVLDLYIFYFGAKKKNCLTIQWNGINYQST